MAVLWEASVVAGERMAKVTAFITRPHRAGPQLVVFDHPMAGVQLPAGSLEPGEDPLDGAFREAWEETGIDGLMLVGRLPDLVDSRSGEGEGRLASDVEIDGRRHPRGVRAALLGRRGGEVRVRVGDQSGWVPDASFTDDVVRHRFHLACARETASEWWVTTPDGGGLCWRCSPVNSTFDECAPRDSNPEPAD